MITNLLLILIAIVVISICVTDWLEGQRDLKTLKYEVERSKNAAMSDLSEALEVWGQEAREIRLTMDKIEQTLESCNDVLERTEVREMDRREVNIRRLIQQIQDQQLEQDLELGGSEMAAIKEHGEATK